MSEKKRVSRRKFLSNSAAGAAGLAVAGGVIAGGAKAMGKAPAILSNRSPNDAIGLGIIGFRRSWAVCNAVGGIP